MLGLAVRQLRADRSRSLLTCLGIAAIFATILLLQGFQAGLRSQLRDVALERDADLIATQAGIRNMVGARSVIPQLAREEVESVEGVRLAHPMTTLPLIYEGGGRKSAIFLVVTDSVGGADGVEEGRLLRGEGEIVVDRGLARIHGLAAGDALTIAGYDFEVVGITEPTAALWTPFAFTNFDSLIEFYFESNLADDLSAFPLVSFFLMELTPEADPGVVAAAVEAGVPDVDVFAPEELAHNDAELGETMLGAILDVLIGLAYVAGLLVVALFMFTTAQGRRRDLGILKALGFADRTILASVVGEAGILTALAIPLGIGIASVTAAGVHAFMPLYRILPLVPGSVAAAVVGCGAFALAGALVPLRLIRGVEPVEVFQA